MYHHTLLHPNSILRGCLSLVWSSWSSLELASQWLRILPIVSTSPACDYKPSCVFWRSISGPHVYMASSLLTKLFLQPTSLTSFIVIVIVIICSAKNQTYGFTYASEAFYPWPLFSAPLYIFSFWCRLWVFWASSNPSVAKENLDLSILLYQLPE